MKKMLSISVAAAFALAALTANAQSANDNGAEVASSGISLDGPYTPYGGGATCPAGPVSSGFTGTTTQLGRIFRDGIASTCPVKAYPGIFNATTTYNYETYTYSNTDAAAACVTVNFDPDAGATPCATNAHMSAYLGSYDPANQGTNFLGDVGSSVAQPFSFEVAGNSQLVLAVTNTSLQDVCTFAFEVVDLPCVEGVPYEPPVELPTQNTLGLLIMGLLLAAAGWFAVRRRA